MKRSPEQPAAMRDAESMVGAGMMDWRARPTTEMDATADKPRMAFLPWAAEAKILKRRIAKGWIGGHEPVKSLDELLERSPTLRAKARAAADGVELPYSPPLAGGLTHDSGSAAPPSAAARPIRRG